VIFNPHNGSLPYGALVTTLDGVAPSSITSSDYIFAAGQTGNTGSGSGSTGTGGSGTGSTGTGSTGTGSTPVDTTAASYTAPSGVTNVVMTGTGAQTVIANNLGDTITANDAASTIVGGTGNDTLIAGHGADVLTGGGGNDTFVFNVLPWNAGHITDFNTATDTLDLTQIFSAAGYSGSNPVADGTLSFVSDGAGDTQVIFNPHNGSLPYGALVTTLDGVAPSSITSSDYIFAAGQTGNIGSGSGSTGTGGSGTGSTPVDTTAASYTAPSGVTNVVMTGTGAQTVHANNLGDTITANDAASTIIGGTGNDTLIAGHGADVLTGGGGNDTFVFNVMPWNAGHITDFNTATDTLNLSGIFSSIGYTGTNPVTDGYLSFVSDGAGDTQVIVNPHNAADPYGALITTLDHVSPASITSSDYVFSASQSTGAGSTGTGSTGTGGSGTGSTGASSPPVDTSAASYTAPSGVTNVVMTGTGAQTVHANNLGDTITANDAASTIIGGTGNDTLIAGHGADMMTGGGGNDTFVFNVMPWNAGHITDFNTATDTLNLSGIFSSIGYTGTNPVADGYLSFVSDGKGDTQVIVNPHNAADPWGALITTLDHVSPASISAHDYVFH
jgi:Ca2+-binding RTX toxin-like protein